jgi:hypothetical protein
MRAGKILVEESPGNRAIAADVALEDIKRSCPAGFFKK